MKKVLLFMLMLMFYTMAACNGQIGESFMHIYDLSVRVDEDKDITVHTNLDDVSRIEYEVLGEGALIIDGRAYGVVSGAVVPVKAKLGKLEAEFKIHVEKDEVEVKGSLFEPIEIESIPALKERDDFIMGADISSIVEVLKRGGKFYDSEGRRTSIFKLLRDAGVNYIRIRLWNDPKAPDGTPYGGGNNDLEVAKRIGRLARAFGMKILLNFHYSDFWADPGKQIIPKAWASYTDSEQIKNALYEFTYQSLIAMEAAGAKADMVQIGNEITPGLITQGVSDYSDISDPKKYSLDADVSGSVKNLANYLKYINAGLAAAKAANEEILTMIHIDRGGNNSLAVEYFGRLISAGVDFDIIGLSYYVFYHGEFRHFEANIRDLAERFGKKVVVAETSYGFTNAPIANAAHILTEAYHGYPLNVEGQARMIRDVIKATVNLPNDLGLGIFYWEPAWLPVPNAGWAGAGTPGTWANQALFSYEGIALPSLDVFKKK